MGWSSRLCLRIRQVTSPAEKSRTGGLVKPAGRAICCGAARPLLRAVVRWVAGASVPTAPPRAGSGDRGASPGRLASLIDLAGSSGPALFYADAGRVVRYPGTWPLLPDDARSVQGKRTIPFWLRNGTLYYSPFMTIV